jgi:hypothetical protein
MFNPGSENLAYQPLFLEDMIKMFGRALILRDAVRNKFTPAVSKLGISGGFKTLKEIGFPNEDKSTNYRTDFETIKASISDSGVANVVLNRPKKGNAFNMPQVS